jgi:DNA-binding CsgD family transcriptional regulator
LNRIDGNHRNAETASREAMDLFAQTESKLGMVEALEALALAVARQASNAEAARLLGAAQSLRNVIGYVRFPVEEEGYQEELNLIGEAMGSEDFDAAWGEGLAMSMEKATSYASKGRGPRKRPESGWGSLTRAELDVVRLVAEGLSNSEIGQKLFISPRTVQVHLSHVFSKMGVASRTELAVAAARTVE